VALPLLDLPRLDLVVTTRELAAYARQAWLLRHDVNEPVLPARTRPGDHVVVCLHGLFATAGVLRPLRQRLERHRSIHTASLTYPVGPGVPALARRLGELLHILPSDVHLHLLGHSVGGVVARYYAQLIGDRRIVQTLSMAAPFSGVPIASRLPVQVARDLHPRSMLLRELRLASPRVPHHSLIADSDRVLDAPLSHALPGADVTVIPRCGHNMLLYDDRAAAIVERTVLAKVA
jgi:pimeloyl-ACP methyl ester carboxylesterase